MFQDHEFLRRRIARANKYGLRRLEGSNFTPISVSDFRQGAQHMKGIESLDGNGID